MALRATPTSSWWGRTVAQLVKRYVPGSRSERFQVQTLALALIQKKKKKTKKDKNYKKIHIESSSSLFKSKEIKGQLTPPPSRPFLQVHPMRTLR